jgi:hypothetical protein
MSVHREPVPDDPAAMLDAVIAALASGLLPRGAYLECEVRRAARNANRRRLAGMRDEAAAAAERAAHRPLMLPVAECLARSVSVGDRAGQDRLLSRPRSNRQWRELAVILAAAADPARISAPAGAETDAA